MTITKTTHPKPHAVTASGMTPMTVANLIRKLQEMVPPAERASMMVGFDTTVEDSVAIPSGAGFSVTQYPPMPVEIEVDNGHNLSGQPALWFKVRYD